MKSHPSAAGLSCWPVGLVLGLCVVSSCAPGAGRGAGGEAARHLAGEILSVTVDAERRDFGSASVRLCSERFPESISLSFTTSAPGCPELFRQGPAATRISRGRICEELALDVTGWEVGLAIALGSSRARARYSRHAEPALHVESGGTTAVTGSVTIHGLAELAGGGYRLAFSMSLEGQTAVEASGTVEVRTEPCTSA